MFRENLSLVPETEMGGTNTSPRTDNVDLTRLLMCVFRKGKQRKVTDVIHGEV